MPIPYNKLTAVLILEIKKICSPERVILKESIKKEYYHDEMPEYGVYAPDLYVEVINADEISDIMKLAYNNNIPVTVRGAGTGLAGGATCKYGGILLSVMKMNKIIEIDKDNITITCEPGVLLSEVSAAASEQGLFYPPDPGERTASIGGTVITNAGGMRAVRYGVTRDYVRCIKAVLPDGSKVEFSSNVAKNTTGYDIKDLVIGSEGTLCILTEVTLRLVQSPKYSQTIVIAYDNIEQCIKTVPKLLQTTAIPTAIEFLERELLDVVEHCLNKPFPVPEGSDVLIVMYDATSKEELNAACDEAADIGLEMGALDVKLCNTAERIDSVWAVRRSILEGMKADSQAQEECDVVVPRSRIADYVTQAKKIGTKYKIRVIVCGHAGDGNIHTELLRNDMSDEEWKKNTLLCLKELYAVSKNMGGQLSGEHGIGNGRIDFLEDFIGTRMNELFKSVKLAFDDKLILNPGKIVSYQEK